jgi:hypothetical protein
MEKAVMIYPLSQWFRGGLALAKIYCPASLATLSAKANSVELVNPRGEVVVP